MKLKIYQSFPSLSGSSHVPHLLQFKILILGLDSNRAFPLQKKKKKKLSSFLLLKRKTQIRKKAENKTH